MMSAFFENIFEKHDGWVPSSVKVTAGVKVTGTLIRHLKA